ncbi:hypothetical protein NMG60_11032941 [Bertholletia excelsa]
MSLQRSKELRIPGSCSGRTGKAEKLNLVPGLVVSTIASHVYQRIIM